MSRDVTKKSVVVGIIFLFVVASVIPVLGGDNNFLCSSEEKEKSNIDWWPMFQHDSNHSGYSTSSAPETNNTLWESNINEAIIESSPAIVNGKVYIGSCYKMNCLYAENGTRVWQYQVGDFIGTSPAVEDGKVYFGSQDCNVYCLDAITGALIWNFTTDDFIASSPTVVNERVYIGSSDGKMYCLNANNGTKIWEYLIGYQIVPSPAVCNGKVYVGCAIRQVYCLDAETGDQLWNRTIGSMSASPAIDNGRLYCITFDDYNGTWDIHCLNANNGTSIWIHSDLSTMTSSPAIAYGKLYVGSHDNNVYCFDANTGITIWNYTTGNRTRSSPAIADGKVFIGSDDYKMYCLDANTGEKIWEYTTGLWIGSPPAIANGNVYIGSWDGKVYCFGNLLETKKVFILGRYSNITEEYGYITIEAINLWIIYFSPIQLIHYRDGKKVTFENETAKIILSTRFIIGFIEKVI